MEQQSRRLCQLRWPWGRAGGRAIAACTGRGENSHGAKPGLAFTVQRLRKFQRLQARFQSRKVIGHRIRAGDCLGSRAKNLATAISLFASVARNAVMHKFEVVWKGL